MYKVVKLFDKAGVIPEGEKITRIFQIPNQGSDYLWTQLDFT